MANALSGTAQYLAKFGDQSIACNQYALSKLGVDPGSCFLKIDEYVILCAPFQMSFKRSLFLASLSKQEMTFFQRYVNGTVGLSMIFSPANYTVPIKLFVRCNLTNIGQMKGRDNVGLFVVDFKTTPDDLVSLLGAYMEGQERLKILANDYSKSRIKMTPETAKMTGYNMYATIAEPKAESKRIHVHSFSTAVLEHMEAAGSPNRAPETSVAYQIYFKKYRISVAGTVESASVLPNGIVRTVSKLVFCPELAEIVDDYWLNIRTGGATAS